MRAIFLLVLALPLAACAGAQATRTSANTMLIDAGAAPACGPQGAAKVASQSAAIETIRAGYERYIITGGSAQSNISVTQMPGTVQTYGTANYGGGFGTFRATSTYTPEPTIVSGQHSRSLGVVMFNAGEPGFSNALDAREVLGKDWQELVKNGIRTCL